PASGRRPGTAPRPSGARWSLLQLLLLLARAQLGLHRLELAVDLPLRGHRLELAVELRPVVREVRERPRAGELLDRPGARLHPLGLVLRALDREARVGHLLADSGRRLADAHLRLRGRVLGLDHFLLRAEGLDLGLELLLGGDELLLLRLEPLHPAVRSEEHHVCTPVHSLYPILYSS